MLHKYIEHKNSKKNSGIYSKYTAVTKIFLDLYLFYITIFIKNASQIYKNNFRAMSLDFKAEPINILNKSMSLQIFKKILRNKRKRLDKIINKTEKKIFSKDKKRKLFIVYKK